MTYWRMQIHPAKSEDAVRYSALSLSAGYIGLGFSNDPGDLSKVQAKPIASNQRDYLAFEREMREGDLVLIIAHHFPFALAKVKGPYNYIRQHVPELGIWFRHFRAVEEVRYYADFKTNVKSWEKYTMTDTISPLRDPGSKSYKLIASWSGVA